MSLIVLICVQFGEKKKSLCKDLRKVYRLENLSKKDEGRLESWLKQECWPSLTNIARIANAVTIDCQVPKIVMNSASQLSEL